MITNQMSIGATSLRENRMDIAIGFLDAENFKG